MDKSVKFALITALLLSVIFFLYKYLLSGPVTCEFKGIHIDRTTILAGETIIVTDSSEGVKSRLWDFGDGQETGTDKSVKHTYDKEGEYKLVLTLNDKCTFDTLIKVLAPSETHKDLSIIGPFPTTAKVNQKLTFKLNKTGFTSYDWTFGERGASNIDKSILNNHEVNYTYNTPGEYTIYLTVDKKQTVSKTIKVIPVSTGSGPDPERIRVKLQAMFRASSDPDVVEGNLKEIARMLCNNKSAVVRFDKGLKTSNGELKSSLSLKDLSNILGFDPFYKNVSVERVKIPGNSGKCPDYVEAFIRQ